MSRTGDQLTVGQLWGWLTADELSERVLDWAPDVAALTTDLLRRSQAFRLVVSPPPGVQWPPQNAEPFSSTVAEAAEHWCRLMDGEAGGAPPLVQQLWATVCEQVDTPVADMADGRPWPLCEAVLMLHAIADEAAAGCGGSQHCRGGAWIYLARARELLLRTGTLSRLPADRVTQLPKTRTTQFGMTHRSLSRYSCATTAGITTVWHRAPVRRLGAGPVTRHANILLLPWPLRIRETDFKPIPQSLRRLEREPFGFFTYTPSEPFDLDLVDRLLDVALDEVDSVDVVALPEGTLEEADVPRLESVLASRHVPLLVGGLRTEPASSDRMAGNCVHIGVRVGGQWWHYRQQKHHRWSLDGGQVEQYNLAGSLHPSVRWWEAMDIPKRAVNIFELGGGLTVAAVVCEDLARLDGVADLLRSIAPTLVVVLLLDGPQLASRWTARYAGVLADDPGSAVISLTAYGMTARSRPGGRPPSGVVAMWKDPIGGLLEIPLEPGAQGVLIKTVHGPSARHAADGRYPVDDGVDLHVVGVEQLRAGASHQAADTVLGDYGAARAPLDAAELSVLASWADAVAHALHEDAAAMATLEEPRLAEDGMPTPRAGRLVQVLAQAAPEAPWRARMGLEDPTPGLAVAISALDRLSRMVLAHASSVKEEGVTGALKSTPREGGEIGRLVRRVLRTAVDATR